jgi:hypothetical protein
MDLEGSEVSGQNQEKKWASGRRREESEIGEVFA